MGESIKIIAYADVHMHSADSVEQSLDLLEKAVELHDSDFVIGLGDFFDSEKHCSDYAERFISGLNKIHTEVVSVFGNHDGGDVSGEITGGLNIFESIFGEAQKVHHFKGFHLMTLTDQAPQSNWRKFAIENAPSVSLVCSHAPLEQKLLDELASLGVKLVINGHTHTQHIQSSSCGRLTQRTLSTFRMGGENGEAAGYALIEINGAKIDCVWVENELSLLSDQHHLGPEEALPTSEEDMKRHFPGEPDRWLYQEPLQIGNRSWWGGASRIQHYVQGELIWDKRYGSSDVDTCPLTLHSFANKEWIIAGGTWLTSPQKKGYHSVLVLDAVTGEEQYRVKVVGVSGAPTISGEVMYIHGQWREVIAVHIPSGKELWRTRAQKETKEEDGLSWHDIHKGGGWSHCPAAKGKHLWVVNSRGDIFAYDPENGQRLRCFVGAAGMNKQAVCSYSPTRSFASRQFACEKTKEGKAIFVFNGCRVDDEKLECLGFNKN